MNSTFKNDIDEGLSASSKYLLSKYFYNEKGDALFVQIMNLPEYYLTNAEHDIFKNQTKQLIQALKLDKSVAFDLIELGAGNGTKTKFLLSGLIDSGYEVTYIPIDISINALNQLQQSLLESHPNLDVEIKQGDYFQVLEALKRYAKPKIILFLGSNIGNMPDAKATLFLKQLSTILNPKDKVVLGVDLIKPKHIVLPAYNDAQGITKQFNLNLLDRINKELGGAFNSDNFEHTPEYDENEGIARSYLTCTKNQSVSIKALNKTYFFKKGERIHMETSRKYNDAILKTLIPKDELEIINKLTDSNDYFADYILNRL